MEALECLDHGKDCRGPVEMRHPLSETGIPYPRCEKHWNDRLRKQDRINRTYGSPSAPSWFDPSYAGERWDDEY